MDVAEKLQACIDTLAEIKASGYWPFASPAPSSTEVKIKEGINDALRALRKAQVNHDLVFKNRDCMNAPQITVKIIF